MELAEKLGVSFATVNRWEKGRCGPSQIAQNAIKQLCTVRFGLSAGINVILEKVSIWELTDSSR